MSREGKLVKNTIILAIGTFFPKLATFITLPILTAYLTQAEYGTYDLILTLVSLVLPAATLQIHSAAFRYLIDVNHDERGMTTIISNIYSFIIPTSLVALVIMYFALAGQSVAVRLAICVYFLFDIIVNANRQIIRGMSRNTDYAISAFISSLGQIALIALLVMVFKTGFLGAVIALAAAEIIASVHLFIKGGIYRYIDFSTVNKEELKELLSYSWPMVPNSLSQWVMHASDRLIITFFMGPVSNAIFSVAYKIPSILSFAQTTFNMAWQENASVAAKDEDVASYYSTMFSWLFDIVSGCMAILIGFTPVLFAILINGDYAAAYNHIPILFVAMLFFCLSTFWGGIFVGYKKTKSVGLTTVVSAIVHLAIVLAGIHWFGLYAASVATLVSYVLLCVLRMRGVEKIIHIDYNWKHIAAVCAVLVLQCVACFLQYTVLDIINFVFGFSVGIYLNRNLLATILKKVKAKLRKSAKKE